MILLKPMEVAQKLMTTEGTLSKWRLLGCGPKFVKLGPRHVAYQSEEVDRWILERVQSSTSGGGRGGRKKRIELSEK